jgi:hypothetical protein
MRAILTFLPDAHGQQRDSLPGLDDRRTDAQPDTMSSARDGWATSSKKQSKK